MKPMVIELIDNLCLDTDTNDLKWKEESFSSNRRTERYYSCDLSGTKVQVRVEIKEDLSMGGGWMSVEDPNLSERILAFEIEVPTVKKIVGILYNKFILPEKVKMQQKDEIDLKTMSNILGKTSIKNKRDRKLGEILGDNIVDKIKGIFK